MIELKQKARDLCTKGENDKLYKLVEDQLKHKATENSIDTWLTLAIVIAEVPIVDVEKSIECLEKALELDENNPIALLILAYVYEYERGGIDDKLLHKIENLRTNSDEINSMLKYVASWSYDKFKKNNPLMEEQLLKESIKLCSHHVWNYKHLAKLYFSQGRNSEARELVKKAMDNVQKVYTGSNDVEFDTNDINDYLNERIKGIYLTDSNVKFLKEMLAEKQDNN